VLDGDEVVADLPVAALVDDAPRDRHEVSEPIWFCNRHHVDRTGLVDTADGASITTALHTMLAAPGTADASWAFAQYDSSVGASTALAPGAAGAGMVVLPGSTRAIAASVDCVGRWVSRDPRLGAKHAVAEATRNVSCTGATPIGITNCLNFSSPREPHIAWQLEEAIAGMGEACRALDVPVTGGNVSLYNQTGGRDIHPTPVIGALGVLDDVTNRTGIAFVERGNAIVLLGDATRCSLDASRYLDRIHGLADGGAPPLDLTEESSVQTLVRRLIVERRIVSANDVSTGGIATALARSAIAGGIGINVHLAPVDGRVDTALFGEGGSRIVVEVDRQNVMDVSRAAAEAGVACHVIGRVADLNVSIQVGSSGISEPVASLARTWREAIPCTMN
jgi:phosphoribosylformylglycinamidine synthase